MKTLNLKKSLVVGLSLLCLTYAGVATAAPPVVHFPPIHMTGLSRYLGQYISVYYVTGNPNAINLNSANDARITNTNMKIRSVGKQLAPILIAQDTLEIAANSAPLDGFDKPNAIEIVIHPTHQFDLLQSETDQGLKNATEEIELSLRGMLIELAKTPATSVFNVSP